MSNFNKFLIFVMLITLLALAGAFFVAEANAQQNITLPNGQTIDVSKLSNQEIYNAIDIAKKSMPEKTDGVGDFVKGIDPNDLDAWRRVVTGTIKDICNDLSITVNDFVKTPVGAGIAVIVFYKFMGKDLLDNALDILIVVPGWFILTGIILFLGWYFYHSKTLYEYRENANGKIEKVNPKRVTAYPWEEKTDKSGLAISLIVCEILMTIIALFLVLV